VVGDSGKVMKRSKPLILDPLLGHPDEDKQIESPDMRETIKATRNTASSATSGSAKIRSSTPG